MANNSDSQTVHNEASRLKSVHNDDDDSCFQYDATAIDRSYKWVDITGEFFDAVSSLKLGELCHEEVFGLFEAMSAIEMMDPKMDAGMLCNRGGKPVLNFDQAISEGKINLSGLTLNEQTLIIDRTLSCFVSWLEGHSLAQTIFTNLYMHKPHLVECRPLKAFCICMHKLIDIVRDVIQRGQVFEEEDFQSVTFGYRLSTEVSEQRVVGMLREVESELNEIVRSRSNTSSNSEIEWAAALNSRVRFIRLFYQFFLSFRKDSSPSVEEIGDCYNLLTTCIEIIPSLTKSTCTDNQYFDAALESEIWSSLGFDPLINQRLLPPTFPRYTKIKTNVDSFRYFETLLIRLKQVLKVTSLNSFNDALHYFIEISSQNPCILSRSIMQTLYMPSSNVLGNEYVVEVLREAAKNFIYPPVLSTKSQLINKEDTRINLELFFQHCIRPFIAFIQVCGYNRARQRDRLSILLEEFAVLQDEAERIDVYLHNLSTKLEPPRSHLACFGTWILYYVLKVMIMFLLSGFELELYSPHEYPYIFWYLHSYLYGWLISALTRADNIAMSQDHYAVEGGSGGKHRSGNSKRTNRTNKKKKGRSNSLEITMCQASQYICGAYYKAMIGFQLEKKIRTPYYEFDNERVRYEHRFMAFSTLITPPVVQYQEYYEVTCKMKQLSVEDLYFSAGKLFHQARIVLEGLPPSTNDRGDVNDLLKVVKTNFVVLKVLSSGHKRGQKHPVDFDFSTHHHFPIFKLN